TAAAVVREARDAREAPDAPAGGGAARPEGGGAPGPEGGGSARPESRGAAGPVALVSVMAANNETGAVQDLAGIVAAVREASGVSRPGRPGYVPVHCDAVAAVGRVPLDVHGWGLDAVSVSGHKLGAPVGVGALVARRDLELAAPMGGGRQERGLRSGTQDVVGARALALALELAVAEREAEAERLERLRSRLLAGALTIPGAHATLPGRAPHLPGTAHLWFEGVSAEALLMALDMAGIDASAGSACHAGVSGPSHVLMAMGLGEEAARGTLRCTMGAGTSLDDVERLLAALPAAVGTARRAHRAH
ncbi:cysteine desulfurase family protein, partial [Actinomyces sp. zg328]|uniref:cysteine desulfurase family protein n=1 Tax=Actinomyces sp. zg328 TaxID=2609287 RepID=UPI001F16739D